MGQEQQSQQEPPVTTDVAIRGDELSRAMNVVGFAGPQLWTSLRVENEESAALLSRAMSQEPKLLSGENGTVITVADAVIHRAEIVNQQSGDRFDTARVVLITPEGNLYSTTGTIAVKSFGMLMSFIGIPPWNPAVQIRVDPVKLSGGRKAVQLVFIRRESKPHGKPKKADA